MKRQRILLLGGSGYLGAQIDSCLRASQEHEVVATCFSGAIQPGWTRVNVKDAETFAALVSAASPDVLIWALRGNDSADAQELIEIGMRVLLAHIPKQAKLIYLSTDGVFGNKPGPFTEQEEWELLDERNPLAGYCLAKIMGEQMVREQHDHHLILRFGPIYGKNVQGIWDKRTKALVSELQEGRGVVRTENLYKSFVHVEDLGRAVAELVTSSHKGTLHLGPEEKASYYTFCRSMAKDFGYAPELVHGEILSAEKARELGIPLDTSLDTSKGRAWVKTEFRGLSGQEK
jgi:dTDP-4-dehydrorhamnose reductase